MSEEIPQQNNGSVPSPEPVAEPENAGSIRNPDGTFKKGVSGNPLGKPPGNISITAAIKQRLMEVFVNPNMPNAEKKTHLNAVIDAIMHNAIINRDQKALKDIWNYIDGLPKGSMDLGVDREGLAELTEFMKTLANPKKE